MGRRPGGWTANGMAYGPHRAIEIISTDLPALRDLQINLAPLLPPHVLAAFAVADVSPEFYITPPRWNYAPTEAFRPFSVPLVEARRRLAADGNPPDFYVRYREIRGGRAERKVRLYRRRGGRRVAGSDADLDEPLSAVRAIVHRYRTFDAGYSPCRH